MKENTINVLLIEDDKVDQMAFARMVGKTGFPYKYLIANSVEGVHKILNTETFDVVIMDNMFGGRSGLELIDALSDIPIIMVTGNGDEELANKARQTGVSAYLIKDSAGTYLEALPSAIEHAIQQKRETRRSL
jgi:CheY-like chemotaxis protein